MEIDRDAATYIYYVYMLEMRFIIDVAIQKRKSREKKTPKKRPHGVHLKSQAVLSISIIQHDERT